MAHGYGGKRPGAGRKPGTSKKARAAALAVLSGRPPEIAVELLDPKERKALRRRLEDWTADGAFAYLMDLLDRTRKSGDLRAEIALLKDLVDRGSGTPGPAPAEADATLSGILEAAERLRLALATGREGAPPPVTAGAGTPTIDPARQSPVPIAAALPEAPAVTASHEGAALEEAEWEDADRRAAAEQELADLQARGWPHGEDLSPGAKAVLLEPEQELRIVRAYREEQNR